MAWEIDKDPLEMTDAEAELALASALDGFSEGLVSSINERRGNA